MYATAGPVHWATPSFGTYDKASTCVNVKVALGMTHVNPTWQVRLVWYDGGANKTLWSGTFTGAQRQCGPTITIPVKHDKVYDIITDMTPASRIGGTYGIDTN